jgi:hypothetical protein
LPLSPPAAPAAIETVETAFFRAEREGVFAMPKSIAEALLFSFLSVTIVACNCDFFLESFGEEPIRLIKALAEAGLIIEEEI